MKKLSLLAVTALAFAIAPQADAAEIFGGVINDADITLAEHLYNPDGSFKVSGVADVGDYLVGVLRINNITSTDGAWLAGGGDFLNGVFVQQVTAVAGPGAPGAGNQITLGNPGDVSGINWQNVGGAGTFNITMPNGSMFAIYESNTFLNMNANQDTATQVSTASSGSLFMALGLVEPTDAAFGVVEYIGGGPVFAVDGDAFGALSLMVNNTGYDFATITEVTSAGALTGQVVFTADFDTNTNQTGPWSVVGNDPARFLPQQSIIPEPASMLMLGMGMGGLGLVRRRRKVKA